jgi:threonylcarbamoyladenosine tRNA methylthiotransferase MtaB
MPLLSLQETPAWIAQARAVRLEGARRPTFAIYTLGCKVNQADSHQIARALLALGFERVPFGAGADAYVIDTCTVTSEADRKSRKAAARAARLNPRAVVAVTGCAATYSSEQFGSIAGDVVVLPNARKLELPDVLLAKLRERAEAERGWDEALRQMREESSIEPQPNASRERAVVKIQDGCAHKCSYCIIPSVRGASTCKAPGQIIHEVQSCVREGAREIVLTGVSMGDWKGGGPGASTSSPSSTAAGRGVKAGRNSAMCDLLRAVTSLEGVSRVRTSSLDPADVDEEWLRCLAQTPLLCPHIHLALQSGSASTLRRMRRRYTPALFLKWARLWREMRPDGGLSTDVIVGFPGETDDEWRETLETVRAARFSRVHVFPFSPRRDTFAAGLPGAVDPQTQKRRVEELIQIGAQAEAEFAAQFVGTPQEILAEGGSNAEQIEGLLPSYVRCVAAVPRGARAPQVGELARVQVLEWREGALHGRVLG